MTNKSTIVTDGSDNITLSEFEIIDQSIMTNVFNKDEKAKTFKAYQEAYLILYKQREIAQQQYNTYDKQINELEKNIKLFQESCSNIDLNESSKNGVECNNIENSNQHQYVHL